MGSKEFAQAVRGSGAEPISTTAASAFEIDKYREGAVFDFDGSAYDYSVDPTETIQELLITVAPSSELDITTRSGTTIEGFPLNGATLALNTIEIDSVTFKDPNSTTARVAGMWVGE